jgi:hypothetical protein
MPGDEAGKDFIHSDLVRAAAAEPIIEGAAGHVAFNPESFRRRVLASAKTQGPA